MTKKKVLIVGAGFFGLTVARVLADDFGVSSKIVEIRSHLGGNSWSEPDPATGIEIHKYGSHIFHTSNLAVWNFVNRFATFNNYRHTVFSRFQDSFVSMPVNLQTISQIYGEALSPNQAREKLKASAESHGTLTPKNFEEAAIAKIGPEIYAALFRDYTAKQWQTDPRDLPAEVFSRLPIRFNFENGYFNDRFQGIPESGYGQLLKNLADHPLIEVHLNTDFFAGESAPSDFLATVYTGPLDRYFNFQLGRLGWRTLDFEIETLDVSDFQGTAVVNYPELKYPYTRIHEFKHYHSENPNSENKTVIMREYSRFADQDDLPFYPVNSVEDRQILEGYRALAKSEDMVFFGGRLGSYQYLDMHMAISSAMVMVRNDISPLLQEQ
jgi:UDP-galactopyranose mutase